MSDIHDMSFADRVFNLAFYQSSHKEMIIRSYKNDAYGSVNSNIDIYVGDISYIELPIFFDSLKLKRASAIDLVYLKRKCGHAVNRDNVLVLVSNNRKYYIVASLFSVVENELEATEMPLHCFIKSGV